MATTKRDRSPATTADTSAQRAQFVEKFGALLTAAGMQRLSARVFACLLAAEDGRMTAAELGRELAVSPAAVSGAVRMLEGVGMIHREREPGTRRDIFVVADDAWHDVMLRSSTTYAPLTAALRAGVEQVGGARTTAGQRLTLSVAFLEFMTAEMQDLSARWDARRAELGL